MTEIDTSKEAIENVCGGLSLDPDRNSLPRIAAGMIQALSAERDAAVARAEKAEAMIPAAHLSGAFSANDLWDSELAKAQDEIEALRARVAALEAALRQADCPHSCKGDDGTVGNCVDHGNCGCCLGEPLKDAALSASPAPAVSQAADATKQKVAAALKWSAENKPGHGFHDVPGVGLVHFNDGSDPSPETLVWRAGGEG